MKRLEEKRAELSKATGMGDALLAVCHPDSITTIKHWITIIQARFEEVSASDVIRGRVDCAGGGETGILQPRPTVGRQAFVGKRLVDSSQVCQPLKEPLTRNVTGPASGVCETLNGRCLLCHGFCPTFPLCLGNNASLKNVPGVGGPCVLVGVNGRTRWELSSCLRSLAL